MLETVHGAVRRLLKISNCTFQCDYYYYYYVYGNSSLLDEGGSASQVPQANVELAGYGIVVWPDSLSEWLVDRAGLQ